MEHSADTYPHDDPLSKVQPGVAALGPGLGSLLREHGAEELFRRALGGPLRVTAGRLTDAERAASRRSPWVFWPDEIQAGKVPGLFHHFELARAGGCMTVTVRRLKTGQEVADGILPFALPRVEYLTLYGYPMSRGWMFQLNGYPKKPDPLWLDRFSTLFSTLPGDATEH